MPGRLREAGLLGEPVEHAAGFRRIVMLLIGLVTVPTVGLLAVGVLMLVFYRGNLDIVFGVLVVTIVACLASGTALALVYLGREARLSQLQSDFVSKVSHELRTPLTSIRLFVETLQRDAVPAAKRDECVEVLARETARLTERIERLLDWGRMEAGKRVYELRPESAARIVDAAVETFRAALVAREAELRLEVATDLPDVVADRGAIVDALVNLLSNALKYSQGVPRIAVLATADRRWVRIGVSDRGIGIPRAEHRRIFQKFYRVDERLSRAAEGSGLGLAIVKHVATAHGGRVEVDSEPGRGSTFTLILPRARPAGRPAEAPRAGEASAS